MRTMSPELARSALEAAPDAMLIIDDAGVVRFANLQAMEMFGFEYAALVDHPIEQLLPERCRKRHALHRQQYMNNVRVRPMGAGLDLFGLRRDGSEFPVEISLSPVREGDVVLIAAAIRDITERRRIESELRHVQSIADTALSNEHADSLVRTLLGRLRGALNSDTTTILLTDAEGRTLIPFASDGLESEVGGEIQVPIGKGAAGRIALAEGPVIFDDLVEIDVFSPILRSQVRSLVGTPLRSGTHLLGVVHAGSFTLRKFSRDEARLLSLAADRIGMAIERTRLYELEQAARRAAEAANQAKSRFLATASHDLRQPLQTVLLLNGTIRRTRLEAIAEEALSQQEQALDAMSRLLNALLDISKLESGAIKPDPSDFIVSDIFEELRREFSSLAQDKGLNLQVASCEEAVHSDPSLVVQILRNLLGNAIKYTRSGWVTLRCLHESSFVRLEVLDTGIGIPADKLRYIYDEFYQVGEDGNSPRSGYGLGLSIVQRIVTLLGARLEVHSQIGKGSAFALTLPASTAVVRPQRTAPKPVSTAQPARPDRVLLVEDDHAVRNATRMLLKAAGYRVSACASMQDALRQVGEDPELDLLITDYHLQDGKTGTDVIAAVRQALNRRIKAILITGDTSTAIARLSRDDRMRVAGKPINAEELLSLMQALLAAP